MFTTSFLEYSFKWFCFLVSNVVYGICMNCTAVLIGNYLPLGMQLIQCHNISPAHGNHRVVLCKYFDAILAFFISLYSFILLCTRTCHIKCTQSALHPTFECLFCFNIIEMKARINIVKLLCFKGNVYRLEAYFTTEQHSTV